MEWGIVEEGGWWLVRISPQYQSRSAVFPLNAIRYDLSRPFFRQTLRLEQLFRLISTFSPPDLERQPQAAAPARISSGCGGLAELLPPPSSPPSTLTPPHSPPASLFPLWPNGIKIKSCFLHSPFFLFHYCCRVSGGDDEKEGEGADDGEMGGGGCGWGEGC